MTVTDGFSTDWIASSISSPIADGHIKRPSKRRMPPTKGLFSRLRDNGFILKPEPVGDAPKKGKNIKPQDYLWTICSTESEHLGLLVNDL